MKSGIGKLVSFFGFLGGILRIWFLAEIPSQMVTGTTTKASCIIIILSTLIICRFTRPRSRSEPWSRGRRRALCADNNLIDWIFHLSCVQPSGRGYRGLHVRKTPSTNNDDRGAETATASTGRLTRRAIRWGAEASSIVSHSGRTAVVEEDIHHSIPVNNS